MDPSDEKWRLRRHFRERRLALSDQAWSDGSRDLCERLKSHPTLAHAGRIHAFWPIHQKREVDIRPALRDWLAEGRTIWLPIVKGNALVSGRFENEHVLQAGAYGVLEPSVDPTFSWEQMDAILVPALAVDHDGWRLGYGGGFYDRLLAGVHVPTVCPIFAWERVPSLPHEAHDVRVTHTVTA
ncbi:MAG: 5-formyltetrahydrofolate cyclo-ligase [Rhodothermales bacterium]